MPVKQKPAAFVTSDGTEFAKALEAERHQTLIDTVAAYEQASRNVRLAMVGCQKTRDGHYLPTDRWPTLYYVTGEYSACGIRVIELNFYYDTRIEIGDYAKSTRVQISPNPNRSGTSWYPIDELFMKRENANAHARELVQEQIQRLKKQTF